MDATPGASNAATDIEECHFCHEDIAAADTPENLSFMAHIERSGACNDAFGAWTDNMQRDFLGD